MSTQNETKPVWDRRNGDWRSPPVVTILRTDEEIEVAKLLGFRVFRGPVTSLLEAYRMEPEATGHKQRSQNRGVTDAS